MINSEYYLLLEINTNATQDEIKKAYRKKAHELHPDKNKDFDTTEQFQKLNKAYETLSNINVDEEIKKTTHDRGYYQDFGFGFIIKHYDKREVDIENYKINIENLSCNCSDWNYNRKHYNKNDIRRLCRHIIASFDVLEVYPKYDFEYEDYCVKDIKVPDSLKIFKDKIISCRDSRDGVDLYWFNELIILNSFIIYISKHKKGVHIFSKKYHKLMFIRLDCEDISRINIDIESNFYSSYTSYYGEYNNNLAIIHKNKSSKYFFNDELKTFFEDKYYECTDFLALFDMKKYCSELDDEQLKINKKTNVFLLYQQYQKYLKLQDESLKQYGTTQELLKLSKTDIDTRKFNATLKEINFITKVNHINRNNWIVKGAGLEFGMNYINNASLMHIKIPDWYKISYYDYETLSLKYEYRYGLLKMTDILWKKSKFNDLLEIIKKYLLTPKIKEKNIERSTKKERVVNFEREAWLKDVKCPFCQGKNIHKKDIRQRKGYQVQRYQCRDCVKIFQEKTKDE